MDEKDRLSVFKAQTQNVRELDKARHQLKRTINQSYKKGDLYSAQIHTKLLALLYSAWVEANFSKLIHTPYGFQSSEIEQIKKVHKTRGLGIAWNKCLELGLRRINNSGRSNYIPNIRKSLTKLIKEYVINPSHLRNKVAHGQWKIALNSANDAENNDLTQELETIDVVEITKWFEVNIRLSMIIEALIESPNRSFHRDYWILITDISEFVSRTAKWSIGDKVQMLKRRTNQVHPSPGNI